MVIPWYHHIHIFLKRSQTQPTCRKIPDSSSRAQPTVEACIALDKTNQMVYRYIILLHSEWHVATMRDQKPLQD